MDADEEDNSLLDYYPLTKMGERFPIADGKKLPVLDPKPKSRAEYLKGILLGISRVERKGYNVLSELGSDPSFPNVVWTCGGGSVNNAWLKIRKRLLQGNESGEANSNSMKRAVKVMKAANSEASFGAAILAASSFTL